MIAEQGMLGIADQCIPHVALGAAIRISGTNPISFGAPTASVSQ